MKLYTSPLSPYSARVRASLYYKAIGVEMIKPSSLGGLASSVFRGINPIGKIPVLVLDDRSIIIESDTIVEYLEDTFPMPPLRPDDSVRRAQARMISRTVELYIMGAITNLLPMMPVSLHHAPIARDAALVDVHLPQLKRALDCVEHFLMKDGPYAIGYHLSTADTTLASFVPFVHAVERYLGVHELIRGHETLARLVDQYSQIAVLHRVFEEVSAALQERRVEVETKFGPLTAITA